MTEELERIMKSEKFPPNAEQLRVIDSSVNSVVSAGAGAGKTAVLSWRFLRLVMEEGVRPEEILTLTFTQKAATEMRDRIYRRLLMAGSAIDSSSLESFSRATISTLDSFCSRIARSDAVSYGLPRDIGVLDDMTANSLYERLAIEFLASEENSEESALISSLFLPYEVMDKFFFKIASKVTLTGSFRASDISASFYNDLCDIYRRQREILSEGIEKLKEIRLTAKQSEKLDLIQKHFEGGNFYDGLSFDLRGTKKTDDVSIIVNTYINPILKDKMHYKIQDYVKSGSIEPGLLQIAVEKYASMINEQKRLLGLLTFNDISALAVTILRDNLEIRKVFRDRYRYIMIDEFQDNNSLQRDLLFLLSEKDDSTSESGRVPSIEELSDSKVFLVGDEKQSIYRFRGADVSVFRSLQDEIKSNGQSLSLKINYRSQKKLIDHFNNVFKKVLENNGENYAARFEEIEAGRGTDRTDPKVVFALYNRSRIESDEDEELDGDILEAEAIGNYCKRVLETDEFLIDGRRPRPDEVAILFKSGTNQMNIEKALRRRGIAYQLTETRSLMLDAVAGDFYAFLQYLLYPEDKRSYVALLKSPFCGLCEESIFNLLVDGKEVLPVDSERFEAFSSFLASVQSEAFRLTIPSLLEKLYIDGGYMGYLASREDRKSFVEHYDYLYSYAISFQESGLGLADFVSFLRNMLGTSDRLPDVSILRREVSGVQLMTIHKSKGLEFPVVIIAGMGRRLMNDSVKDYVFEYNGKLIATSEDCFQKILQEDEKAKEEAEAKRVLYVGMTRAEDHLILIGGYKEKQDRSKGDDINQEKGRPNPEDLRFEKIFTWYKEAIGADVLALTAEEKNVVLEDVTGTKIYEGSQDRKLLSYDFSDLGAFASDRKRISVSDLKRENAEEAIREKTPIGSFAVDEIIRREKLETKFGTLCHLVLEKLIGEGSYEGVECSIAQNEEENALLLDTAKSFAKVFTSSELYRKYVKDHSTEEELRFYTTLEIAGDSAVEGVIDLLVHGEKFNLVIDYKSDSFKDPEEHKLQVLSYIKVVKDLYPEKECYGTLFYLREGKVEPFWDVDGNVVNV